MIDALIPKILTENGLLSAQIIKEELDRTPCVIPEHFDVNVNKVITLTEPELPVLKVS